MPAIITSREFARHTYRAQKEAEKSPVVITNRGRPAHVLLSYAELSETNRRPSERTRGTAKPELSQ